MNFEDFNLADELLQAITNEGYTAPSPIQQEAIPLILDGKDVLGCAQTGTGKTAAFALPILQKLLNVPESEKYPRKIKVLVLTPTRELALQISESFKAYGCNTPLKCCVVFGGVSAKPQIEQLKNGTDILVATPGRLDDLHNQNMVNLKNVDTLVLDEADRMLDMGFVHDVKKIISWLPKKRQTLFFSATMPNEIKNLVSQILVNPVKVEVTPVSSTVDIIKQSVYFVDKCNKPKLLIHLLKDETIVSSLVFSRTKHGSDKLVKILETSGIKAQAIHGNKSQGARQLALDNFKSGQIRVLVATDIAARGIDIDELSHVFNYDLPNIPETYVHRIGRTGRAGLSGMAIAFCDFEEKDYLDDIIKLTGKNINVVTDHPFPMQIFTVAPKETKQRHSSRPNANSPKTERAPSKKDSRNSSERTPSKKSSSNPFERASSKKSSSNPFERASSKKNSHTSYGKKRTTSSSRSKIGQKKGYAKKG